MRCNQVLVRVRRNWWRHRRRRHTDVGSRHERDASTAHHRGPASPSSLSGGRPCCCRSSPPAVFPAVRGAPSALSASSSGPSYRRRPVSAAAATAAAAAAGTRRPLATAAAPTTATPSDRKHHPTGVCAADVTSVANPLLLTAKHRLEPFSVFFYSSRGFWPSYCQISTDLDKIYTHTYCCTEYLWADLDRDRRVGGSRPNQNDCVFVIPLTHPKSCIETTDRRDFGVKPSKLRRGRVLSWKIPEFCSVFSRFRVPPSTVLRTAYRKQFYPKPMVPMESRDSEGVPFARLESLWPGIWQIYM